MANFKSEFNFIGKPPYKKEDLISQEIFGIEYFNWLSDWEQFHLDQKYKLGLKIFEKIISNP